MGFIMNKVIYHFHVQNFGHLDSLDIISKLVNFEEHMETIPLVA